MSGLLLNDTPKRTLISLQWEAFCTAIQFLTRVPLPSFLMAGGLMAGSKERYREALSRSAVYFPLVGSLVAICTVMVTSLIRLWLPVELVVILALAFEAMLTGAFHEDALADSCDALGGGWTREQVLEILKDSRLGTYGTLGLGLGVACRYFALTSLAGDQWYWLGVSCLVASATLGRWAILWLMYSVQPISDRPTQARDVGGQQSVRAVVGSGLIGLPGVIGWLWLDYAGVFIALVASAIVLAAYRLQILRRVGGMTGDFLGCGCFLVQLTVLIVASSRCYLQS